MLEKQLKNKKNIEAGINEKINNRNKLKSKLDILKEILVEVKPPLAD